MQSVLDYIEERLHEPIGLEHLAAIAYVSQPQLYRLFYACTGHPVKAYIRKRRISVASQWLDQTSRPLKEIAIDCGFESFQSFAKAFKKLTGVTPAEYRSAASTYFRFEPVAVSAAWPTNGSVKLLNMPQSRLWVRTHASRVKDGLEPAAFRRAYEAAGRAGWPLTDTRFLGYDIDRSSDDSQNEAALHEYRTMIMPSPGFDNSPMDGAWRSDSFPGGLYAVVSASAESAASVTGAWNRLLSDWLPSSAFSRREGPFVEEFIHYKGNLARMHLHLPIRRKTAQPFIRIVDAGPRRIALVKSFGPNAYEEADRRLAEWIGQSGYMHGRTECGYYMSYRDDCSRASDDFWWEAGFRLGNDGAPVIGLESKTLGGGEYACLTTETYGTMRGVLDMLCGWVDEHKRYERDDSRQWFAEYALRSGNSADRLQATCYLPIRPYSGVTTIHV